MFELMDEKRNFQRVPFVTRAEINCNSRKYRGRLLNISLQGALVSGKGFIPFAEGDRCQLSIHLLGTEITLQFEADLIHRQDDRFGFRFISEDLETASHLRRLLELNIGSAETIDREVTFRLQDK